jgi:ribosomal protein L32
VKQLVIERVPVMERDSSSSRSRYPTQAATNKQTASKPRGVVVPSQSYHYDTMLSALSALALSSRRLSSTSRMAAAVATPLRQAWDALVGGANVRTNVRTNAAANQSPFDSIHDTTVCHHLPPPHHQTALWLAVPKQKVTRHKKRLKTTVQKRIPLRRDIVTDPRTGETTLRHKMPFNWKDYLPGQVF